MRTLKLVITLGLAAAGSVHGQQPAAVDQDSHHSATSGIDASMTTGEVRKVDRDAKKLTLRHGSIPQLGMPEMTMVFRVADPKMLEGLEPNDKVRFKADRIGGQITVTALEMAE